MNLTLNVGQTLDISLYRAFCDAIDFAKVQHNSFIIEAFVIDLKETIQIRDSGIALLMMLKNCTTNLCMPIIIDNYNQELAGNYGDLLRRNFHVFENQRKGHS